MEHVKIPFATSILEFSTSFILEVFPEKVWYVMTIVKVDLHYRVFGKNLVPTVERRIRVSENWVNEITLLMREFTKFKSPVIFPSQL